jgi:PAS domain S-box-containing protein
MIDTAPDLIWAKDINDHYIFANQAICDRLLKCRNMEEAVGKTDLYFAERERAAGHRHTFGEICVNSDVVVKENRKSGRFREYGLVRGEQLVLDVHKAPIFDDNGDLLGTVGCGRDVTREDEIQAELNKAATAIRNIIEDVEPIAVQGYDEQRRVTLWNKASEDLYGYTAEEAMGRKLEDLIIPQEMVATVISLHHRWIRFGEKIPPGKLVLRHKDGSDVHVYSSHTIQETINGKEMFCIDLDLSAEKRAEEEKKRLVEQLEKAHRLEAIGNLAGGIAHDFNNILTAITGYAEIAKSDLDHDHPAVDCLNHLLLASNRAVELVKQILTFSRNNQAEIRPVRIDLIAKEAMEMMRSSLPTTIDIRLNFAAGLSMVLADPIRIHRVIVNLCTNAFHAMRNQRGQLEVGLNDCTIEAEMIPGGWSAEPGQFVKLTIHDDGVGMNATTLN